MSKPLALIVDDEPDIRELVTLTLSKMDIEAKAVSCLKDAMSALNQNDFSFCLADMHLGDGEGITLVEYIQKNQPHIPIAIITAYGNTEGAVNSLKAGAYDYVSKPIDLAMLRRLVNEALRLSQPTNQDGLEDRLIGESSVMIELKDKIAKVSRSHAPIYIYGGSGVGKELVALSIHEKSACRDYPFIAINCGAIPQELMESEFFGHVKGSFTGANANKKGLFEAANGGTLFLDEVADLPLNMQVKLLRAIQEKAIRPIGAQTELPVNVRILSASHKDLNQLVTDGTFRQDLYYRINVIALDVPSLKKRIDDIPRLTEHLLMKIGKENQISPPVMTKEGLAKLSRYDYPGNVRELENILERATTLCDKSIKPDDIDLPEVISSKPNLLTPALNEQSLDDYLIQKETELILKALKENKWNKTKTAKSLGLSFRKLRYRIDKLGLDDVSHLE